MYRVSESFTTHALLTLSAFFYLHLGFTYFSASNVNFCAENNKKIERL